MAVSNAVSAKLLALELPVLRLLADLLTLELTRLHLLAVVLTFELAGLSRADPGFANLLALETRRAFLPRLLANLLAFKARGTFGPHLDALSSLRPIESGHSLRAFGAHLHALSALRAVESGHPLRPFGAHLHTLSALRPIGANLLLGLSLLTTPVPVGPRGGRGGDRQCGDARGEKYPGHHNFSF